MGGLDASGIVRGQDGSARLSSAVDGGPYRLRSAAAVPWPANGFGRRAGAGRWMSLAAVAIGRSTLPVFTLTLALSAVYIYMDQPMPNFTNGHSEWLRLSHLLLPAAYFTVHLTNRRYGPSYAFAQIVLSFALCTAMAMFGPDIVRQLLPEQVVPSEREVAAFVLAFVGAGFLSVLTFDGARGPRWWTAPLTGSLVAGIAFALLFYPVAYAGTGTFWISHMLTHAAILLGAAIAGLVPFYLLRSTIEPLPGFGGF